MIGWEWSSDPSQVQSTLESLQDAQKNLSELQREQELAHKKQDLEGQIKELQELKDAWTKNLDDINDAIKNSKEVQEFYDKFFKASNEERKVLLEEFTKKYKNEVFNQINSSNESIKKLEELKAQWSKAMDIQEDLSKYAGAQEWLKKFENANYAERKSMLSSFTNSWTSYYNQQISKINELQNRVDSAKRTLDGVKSSANNAISSMNSASRAVDNLRNKVTSSTMRWDGNTLWSVKQYGDGRVTQNRVGAMYNTGSNNNQFISSSGNKYSKYADGGVADFGGRTGLVDWTGAWDNDKWVDGTPDNKEVILNNRQASEILYRMANQPIVNKSNNNSTSKTDSTYINSLTIQAKDGDTLERLLTQAKLMVKNQH